MDEKNRKAYRKETKEFLIDNIDQLNSDVEHWLNRYKFYKNKYEALVKEQREAADTPHPKKEKHPINVSLAADLWPLTDWKRLSLSPWGAGRYFQVCLGPIRLDVFE